MPCGAELVSKKSWKKVTSLATIESVALYTNSSNTFLKHATLLSNHFYFHHHISGLTLSGTYKRSDNYARMWPLFNFRCRMCIVGCLTHLLLLSPTLPLLWHNFPLLVVQLICTSEPVMMHLKLKGDKNIVIMFSDVLCIFFYYLIIRTFIREPMVMQHCNWTSIKPLISHYSCFRLTKNY